MTTNYHTPHSLGAPLTSAGLNAPLSELDTQVTRLSARSFLAAEYGAVGDGATDDAAALQAAITAAAAAGGGDVIIPGPNEYKVGTGLVLDDGVFLRGIGMPYLNCRTATAAPSVFADTKSKVGVIGLHIENDGTQPGVRLHACTDSWIEGNYILLDASSTDVQCIELRASTAAAGVSGRSVIRDNDLFPTNLGILVQGRATGPHYIRDVVIAGNRIDCSGEGSTSTPGSGVIKVDLYSERIVVSGNIIRCISLANDGINVQENTKHVTVAGNVVSDPLRAGIRVEEGQTGGYVYNCAITGNSIFNSAINGIQLRSVTGAHSQGISVVGNTIHTSAGSAIAENSGSYIDGLVISGNAIYGHGDSGIAFRSPKAVISGNYIGAETTHYSIEALSTTGIGSLVTGNICASNNGTNSHTTGGTATDYYFRNNIGLSKTENHGSAAITSGNTSVTVSHGVKGTPLSGDIQVTPASSFGSAAKFWISGISSTQFTINVDANPGATVTFHWQVLLGRG
ncbi:MAG TPA: hypothetical protein VFI40_04960 [Nocardioides sp.]|nr:hypothetical protein [Nocardioides sp.]